VTIVRPVIGLNSNHDTEEYPPESKMLIVQPISKEALVVEALSAQTRIVVLAEALLLTVILGAADVWTGSEYSFSIFYLIPIALTALALGRKWALANAVMASVTWLAADYASGHVYSSAVIPYWNATVRLGYFVLLAVLFDRLRLTIMDERDLARQDPLTGLHNRRAFEELSATEVERATRYGHPVSLAFIDLDHFKQVNDQFGHDTGDDLLRVVATTLLSTLRSSDVIARFGGDEFAVLMPETDPASAVIALEKSRLALAVRMSTNHWPVTFSIGLADGGRESGTTLPALLASADRLMYEAKRGGRDRIVSAAIALVPDPIGPSGSG